MAKKLRMPKHAVKASKAITERHPNKAKAKVKALALKGLSEAQGTNHAN